MHISSGLEALKAAKKVDDYAEAEVGWHYLNGEFVIKNEKLAYKWFKKSADQENTYAQSMLGWMVAIGTGTDQNYKEGFNISIESSSRKYFLISASALSNFLYIFKAFFLFFSLTYSL